MTARAVADGVVAGCDVAALQVSEMGRPIYERWASELSSDTPRTSPLRSPRYSRITSLGLVGRLCGGGGRCRREAGLYLEELANLRERALMVQTWPASCSLPLDRAESHRRSP
jgi:hypothetical protein